MGRRGIHTILCPRYSRKDLTDIKQHCLQFALCGATSCSPSIGGHGGAKLRCSTEYLQVTQRSLIWTNLICISAILRGTRLRASDCIVQNFCQ